MFNFPIDKLVGKLIINKCLFYISKFIKEDSSRRRDYFSTGSKCIYDGSFIGEETFTVEIVGARINIGSFFYVEVVNLLTLFVSLRHQEVGLCC